jgi:replicative DNA helicase
MVGRRRGQKIVHLDQSTADRVPPNSNDAEMAVLGAMMLEKEAGSKVIQILSAESFYRESHRIIFAAMVALSERNQPIDIITLNDELRKIGKLADIGGSHYLSELNMRTPTAANVEHHARIVFEKALKRRLISTAMETISNCYSDTTDAFEELDRAEQQIFQIAESRGNRSYHSMKRLAIETVEMLETISARRAEGGGTIGVPTGLVKLDNLTGGFQKSDLIIIAARPSMGKTGVALSIARNAAIDYKKAVAFFSLEMAAPQLVLRLISSEAKVDAHRLRTGDLKNDDWQRIVSTIHRLSEAPLYIDDSPALSIMELRARARLMKREHNIEMIMVDYLQLMHAKAESREREISIISRGLKQLAKELDIPIIALSQLNRSVESRGDKRPMLSDLRESGCLAGETLVTMADSGARIPIRELAGRRNFAVWALNEESGRIERAVVTNAFATGVKTVYRMTTRLGRVIRATANHRFLTTDGWRRLDELTPAMHLALPRQIPASVEGRIAESELALLGHLLANGSTIHGPTLRFTSPQADLCRLVGLLATQVFGRRVATTTSTSGIWNHLELCGKTQANLIPQWLDRLGVGRNATSGRSLPTAIFSQPARGIATFIRHFWAGCGSIGVEQNNGITFPSIWCGTNDGALARDIISLLLRLGIRARLSPAPRVGVRGLYRIVVGSREDMLRFAFLVGAAGSTQIESLPSLVGQLTHLDMGAGEGISVGGEQSQPAIHGARDQRRNSGRAWSENAHGEESRPSAPSGSDIYWDPIVSIEEDGCEEVYDLTVPGPHNFLAEDIIVHNSIEQDADVVMFVHRPEYYGITVDEDGMPTEGTAELILGKQRNGPTGVAKTAFIKEFARFENLAFQYDNAPQYLPPAANDEAPF